MKLVMLAYLEGDEKCVDRMLADLDVDDVQSGGHRGARAGWIGWMVRVRGTVPLRDDPGVH